MGLAIETISVSDTDTTLGELAVVTGSTLTIKHTPNGRPVHLVDGWYTTDSGGDSQFRFRSPRLHDNVDNFRTFVDVGQPTRFWPLGCMQSLIPQDTLTIEGNVTTSGRITASLQIYYEDLPGAEARLVNWSDLRGRVKNIISLRQDVAAPTAGAYSVEQAITADQNLLKANTDYAILGVTADAELHQVSFRGPDTGNLRIGVPYAPGSAMESANYFKHLNMVLGAPTIPVINSANRDATLVDVLSNAATEVDFAIILAELS